MKRERRVGHLCLGLHSWSVRVQTWLWSGLTFAFTLPPRAASWQCQVSRTRARGPGQEAWFLDPSPAAGQVCPIRVPSRPVSTPPHSCPFSAQEGQPGPQGVTSDWGRGARGGGTVIPTHYVGQSRRQCRAPAGRCARRSGPQRPGETDRVPILKPTSPRAPRDAPTERDADHTVSPDGTGNRERKPLAQGKGGQ